MGSEETTTGQQTVEKLGNRDLNQDGIIVNLAIVGSSRFYDISVFEGVLQDWISKHTYPDLIILGGSSGIDFLAERWAGNNFIPVAVFNEEWGVERKGLYDDGRPEAGTALTSKILDAANHVLALPSSSSKWTPIVISLANERGIPVTIYELD
jgi:hypothetical protein